MLEETRPSMIIITLRATNQTDLTTENASKCPSNVCLALQRWRRIVDLTKDRGLPLIEASKADGKYLPGDCCGCGSAVPPKTTRLQRGGGGGGVVGVVSG